MTKQIDKAFEEYEKHGVDPDEIMMMNQEELDKMYDGEVEVESLELSSLRMKLTDAEVELSSVNQSISDLVLNEIPSCEEYLANVTRSDEVAEARNDLLSANNSLSRLNKRKTDLERLIIALKEKIARRFPKEVALYDEPDAFEREELSMELDEIERRLQSIDEQIRENDALKEDAKNYYQRHEIDQDNSDLAYEKNMLLAKRNKIKEQLAQMGTGRK